jgi:group I intron endonuclease
MIIYKVTNKINGKMYIGQTVNELSIRKAGHLYEARRDNTNIVFHNAIKKYGKNNFKWEIITTADSMNKLNILETYFINKYHTFLDDIKCNGYNMTTGGDNSLLSNDAKQKNK